MPRRLLPPLAVGAICCASCVSAPPIPVDASPSSLNALVGEWDGRYTGADTGRGGSLWFKLVAGDDHAHGDVLMIPRGRREPYYRYPPSGWPLAGQPADVTHLLAIQFVHAADGRLDGRLEPYWDPDCPCEAVTTFRGRLLGDRIEGTFNTRLRIAGEANGRWVADRRRFASIPIAEGRHD